MTIYLNTPTKALFKTFITTFRGISVICTYNSTMMHSNAGHMQGKYLELADLSKIGLRMGNDSDQMYFGPVGTLLLLSAFNNI
jgi:hypothetical protein